MQINEWVAQAKNHFVNWVEEYIESEEGKRLHGIFRSLENAQEFESFICDLEHRISNTDEEQRIFWDVLLPVIGNDLPMHLALMEPLAQCDATVTKLVSLVSEEMSDPKALVAAIGMLQRGDTPLPRGITNTAGWSTEKVWQRLSDVKIKLDWQNTTVTARMWWESFENENSQRSHLILRLAEELAARRATISEFYEAYLSSNTDNIQANLHYLDYRRLRKEESDIKKAVALTGGGSSRRGLSSVEPISTPEIPWSPSDSLLPGITNTSGWTVDRLTQRISDVKLLLDWRNTTGGARKWWEAFEEENSQRLALIVRLAEELAVRKATITEFFLAYVYSNVDNIRAILYYLDYTRVKKQDERKKKETSQAKDLRELAEDYPRHLETLGLVDASCDIRDWWALIEGQHREDMRCVYRAARDLSAGGVSLQKAAELASRNPRKTLESIVDELCEESKRQKDDQERLRQLAATYSVNRQKIGLKGAGSRVHCWWGMLERAHSADLAGLHRLTAELAVRGMSATSVYKATRGSKAYCLAEIRRAVFGYPDEIPVSADGVFDGRYRFIATLSESARSLIVEAEYIRGTPQRVALKFSRDAGARSPKILADNLRNEALTLVSCRHRYVIRLDDFHTVKELCYLSMEYCPGSDLSSRLRNKGQLSAASVLKLLKEAAEALDFIHATGVVHRQLNPRHLLFGEDGHIRITDFSGAMLPGDEPNLTSLKERMETLDYAAPELVEGQQCDIRSDIFSLGALFLEAATGRRWVGGVGLGQAMKPTAGKIRAEMLKPRSSDSRKLAESLARAVTPQPNDRWQSASELLCGLAAR